MPRKLLAVLPLAILMLIASYSFIVHFKQDNKGKTQPGDYPGFAVVELFTSEGCSSCPPADAAVAQLLNAGKNNVYVLGFHVDYWNSLGWKDVYSDASYSERQQQYADVFRLNSIYTPQAVVNGNTEFTGSDTRRLNDVVDASLARPAASAIEVSAKGGTGVAVNVSYKLNMPLNGGRLNIALVQLHAQSKVQRGENSGRLLNHVNVVRDFKSVSSKEAQGVLTLQLPAGLTPGDCKIIAFAQDGGWKITSAAETVIM